MKRFGLVAFDNLLGATGVMLVAVEDPEALARVQNRFVDRKHALANRASGYHYILKRTRKDMRELGRAGGVKSGEARRTRVEQKRALSEMKRQAVLKRWHPQDSTAP
jgi:hypothetical protein